MQDVRDYGFYWGTSSTALSNQTHLNSSANAAETFSSTLSSLEASTTYYYQAYVEVLDGGQLKEYKGAVKSFTTASSAGQGGYRPYLSGYEIPAISLKAGTTYGSGDELSGYGYKWYNHETANAMQKVVTHTYRSGSKTVRNYTCLVDGNKMAPLWSAFVMHKDAYPDNGVGRNDGWKNDPAIPSSWQQGGVSGYSRGHFVASNYRQASTDANKATFYHTNQAPQYQTGFNDGYGGTIILENMTVKGILWTDSHPFIIRSGDYNQLRNMKRTSVTSAGSGTITIEGGSFKSFYNYSSSGWTYGDYILSGGKYAFNPTEATNVTIASGCHVAPNTGSDSGTYPYAVEAD